MNQWRTDYAGSRKKGRRKQSMREPVRLSTYIVTRLRETASLVAAPRTALRRVVRGTLEKLHKRI